MIEFAVDLVISAVICSLAACLLWWMDMLYTAANLIIEDHEPPKDTTAK